MLWLFEYASGESPTARTPHIEKMMVYGSSIAMSSLSAPWSEKGWDGLKISDQSLFQTYYNDDASQVRDVVVDGAPQIECDKAHHPAELLQASHFLLCLGRLRHDVFLDLS